MFRVQLAKRLQVSRSGLEVNHSQVAVSLQICRQVSGLPTSSRMPMTWPTQVPGKLQTCTDKEILRT